MVSSGVSMGAKYFGAAVRRTEDPRFLRGEGRYVDDIKLPRLLHAAFVRSPHGHARIRKIDTSALPSFRMARSSVEIVLRSPGSASHA